MIHTQPVRNSFFLSSNSTAMGEAEALFRRSYPAFDTTSLLDKLRMTEYSRLDDQEQMKAFRISRR